MSRARLLLITDSGDISQEFELNSPNVIIGRAPQSNVVISDSDISRLHAQIVTTSQGFFVSDLGSTNGTYINGVAIKPKQMLQLKSNDQVNLGRVSLLFQVVSDSIPSPKSEAVDPNVTKRIVSQPVQNQVINSDYEVFNKQNTSQITVEAPTPVHPYVSEISQPVYVPASSTVNIEWNSPKSTFSEDELKLAEEIFGEAKAKAKSSKANAWASWNKTNLFSKKAAPTTTSQAEAFDEFSDEELAKQVLGQAEPASMVPAIAPKPYQQVQSDTQPQLPNLPEPINYANMLQNTQIEPYKIDNESFYYPQSAEVDPSKFSLEAYSYNESAQTKTNRDPFADLNFRDDDSLLSKFSSYTPKNLGEKLEMPKAKQADVLTVLKRFMLPISIIGGAVLVAAYLFFRNSGVFG